MDPLLQNIAILLIASFHNCIYAYPNGQVTDSCNTMIPIHGASTQTTTSPYTLSLAKNTYSSGENIAVTLSSTTGTTQFKGFLIQARSGSTSTPVGSFKISANAQTLTCSSSADSVSHISGSGKTSIQVTWVAPSSNIADIQIRATIVQTEKTFWTNVVSSKIAYVAPASSATSSTTVGNSTSATTVTTTTTKNQANSGFQMTDELKSVVISCTRHEYLMRGFYCWGNNQEDAEETMRKGGVTTANNLRYCQIN
ncbi:putative defense protein 3 [Mixophyes fleayi]|uniref:putative defense protein 3 n=1 Tax=Mixophyes fleayi TaxID=3061075 RepID=UPI003F4DB569